MLEVPTHPQIYMVNYATLKFIYSSAMVFQDLKLIIPVVFGAVD